jgi:pyrophosphatase PpaX
MSFDAVLFDLDGTLLDSIELILASYHHTLKAHGLPPRSDADILAGLGTTLNAQFHRWGYGDRLEELTSTYVRYNLEVHDEHVRAFPGVSEIVHELAEASVPMGLVTSKRRLGGEQGVRALGLAGRFTAEVYGDEVTRPKPDPEPVHKALAELGLPASSRVTFVGDAIHDLEAGRAAGVHTIAVSWGSGRREELSGADELVDEAARLRTLLLG